MSAYIAFCVTMLLLSETTINIVNGGEKFVGGKIL